MTSATRLTPISLILIFCVLVAGSVLTIHYGDQMRFADERSYYLLGQSLATGNGYRSPEGEVTAFRPPGYPMLISAIYNISEHPVATKLVNTAALALSCLIMIILLQDASSLGSRYFPLLIFAYPVLFYSASTLYPQTIGTLLLLISILCIHRYDNRKLAYAIGGVSYGYLVLTIPAFLIMSPIVGFYIIFSAGKLSSGFLKACIFALCTALAIAPWTIRNYQQFGAFVPVATNSGINFLLGNSPATGPNTGVNVDLSDIKADGSIMDEVSADRFYRKTAFDWIKNNPADAFSLYFRKVLNYFQFRNNLATQGESKVWKNILMAVTYYPLLVFTIVRMFYHKKYPLSNIEKLLYLLYFSNALLSAIFFTRIRFRLPYDFLMLGVAASFAGLLLEDWLSKRQALKSTS